MAETATGEDAPADVRSTLKRVGRWWLLTLFAGTGVGSNDGFFLQPLLLFAPPLLLLAVNELRDLAPMRPRRLFGICALLGALCWFLALAGMFTGGPFSPAGLTAEYGQLVLFVVFCIAMMWWAGDQGAEPLALRWRRPIYLAAALVAAWGLSTLAIASWRLLDGRSPFGQVDLGAEGLVVLIPALALHIAAMVSAAGAMAQTRAWLTPRRGVAGTGGPEDR